MKEVLIITNYYPPEIGAASNRIHHLATGLKDLGFQVSVITPLPNYPNGKILPEYKAKRKIISNEKNITVIRLWLYANNSKNKFLRLFAMLSYSFSLLCYFAFNSIPKTVIIQSPPLLVAFTSTLFLRKKNRKLILNVSDLWPQAGLDLGALNKGIGYSLLKKIEKFNYKRADLVLGQSHEILDHIKNICPDKYTFLYRNYPNFNLPNLNHKPQTNNKKIKMVYAGLLGVAQGILKLCHELDYTNIEFHIYGNGAETIGIKNFIAQNQHLPISFHGELTRKKLHQELLQYDLTIIPLLNRIYGSVPSKIFEYAHLGLPMLYFGGGEGESIILNNKLGWIAPEKDYEQLNIIINSIKKESLSIERKKTIKETAKVKFDFNNQLSHLKTQV
ncbi:glycosyltransferase family 4 protein [Mangrovimonas aestuarii]|uniref:glycosyltransferase family 4 protein n=1 Tax=Mangrovimonas aestuarii TaxID=3018443 RepID=UPI002379B311|nr:glycosyltransferase family 4 protein [Mangrovimonas aestuarii]